MLSTIESNPVSPKTEIEDSLNGKLFFETLKEYERNNPELSDLIKAIKDPTEESTFFALNLSPSKQELLEKFFNRNNHRFEFLKNIQKKLIMNIKCLNGLKKQKICIEN